MPSEPWSSCSSTGPNSNTDTRTRVASERVWGRKTTSWTSLWTESSMSSRVSSSAPCWVRIPAFSHPFRLSQKTPAVYDGLKAIKEWIGCWWGLQLCLQELAAFGKERTHCHMSATLRGNKLVPWARCLCATPTPSAPESCSLCEHKRVCSLHTRLSSCLWMWPLIRLCYCCSLKWCLWENVHLHSGYDCNV